MKKLFTVSTFSFNSLKEASTQLEEWEDEGTLNPESKVFRITECYIPKVKVVLVRAKHEKTRTSKNI